MSASWSISRRALLRGVGVSIALPWLDAMAGEQDDTTGKNSTPPARLCGVFFPYGINNFDEDDEHAHLSWWPSGSGRTYTLRQTMAPLEPWRQQMSLFQGLDHPGCRTVFGHATGDCWLTGSPPERNSISVDQVVAQTIGKHTRFPSLVLSSEGGIGIPGHSFSQSFDRNGRVVPSLDKPQIIFDRLFTESDAKARGQRLNDLQKRRSVLDRVKASSQSVMRRVGQEDKRKLDEYLESIRQVEIELDRQRRWLAIPKPNVDGKHLSLDQVPVTKDPAAFMKVMYDLIALALRTDSTRSVTFQLGPVSHGSIGQIHKNWATAIGLSANCHELAHHRSKVKSKTEVYAEKAKWDSFLLEQLSYFLGKLASFQDGETSLLDRTAVLYGSGTSDTHAPVNLPVLVAGGSALGLRHGSYHRYIKKLNDPCQPLCNLWLRVLQAVGIETERFGDSTGPLQDM